MSGHGPHFINQRSAFTVEVSQFLSLRAQKEGTIQFFESSCPILRLVATIAQPHSILSTIACVGTQWAVGIKANHSYLAPLFC